ncbi:hypothetical protein B0H11DRAFT_1940141 [Mycena galericulata]|nr:hypothetical protein B0H11DRAFT_1940141 [Mycena galericulata]
MWTFALLVAAQATKDPGIAGEDSVTPSPSVALAHDALGAGCAGFPFRDRNHHVDLENPSDPLCAGLGSLETTRDIHSFDTAGCLDEFGLHTIQNMVILGYWYDRLDSLLAPSLASRTTLFGPGRRYPYRIQCTVRGTSARCIVSGLAPLDTLGSLPGNNIIPGMRTDLRSIGSDSVISDVDCTCPGVLTPRRLGLTICPVRTGLLPALTPLDTVLCPNPIVPSGVPMDSTRCSVDTSLQPHQDGHQFSAGILPHFIPSRCPRLPMRTRAIRTPGRLPPTASGVSWAPHWHLLSLPEASVDPSFSNQRICAVLVPTLPAPLATLALGARIFSWWSFPSKANLKPRSLLVIPGPNPRRRANVFQWIIVLVQCTASWHGFTAVRRLDTFLRLWIFFYTSFSRIGSIFVGGMPPPFSAAPRWRRQLALAFAPEASGRHPRAPPIKIRAVLAPTSARLATLAFWVHTFLLVGLLQVEEIPRSLLVIRGPKYRRRADLFSRITFVLVRGPAFGLGLPLCDVSTHPIHGFLTLGFGLGYT